MDETTPMRGQSVPQNMWQSQADVGTAQWRCGFCSKDVAASTGYFNSGVQNTFIRICPNCGQPTYFTLSGERYPGSALGEGVSNVPDDISSLYDEARIGASVGAHTAAVLVCRKILMNVAVEKGAEEGKTFAHYVEHLANEGFIPPNGSGWVDYIRRRSNEANHKIVLMTDQDSVALITFVGMLLRFIYEFPEIVPGDPNG